MCNSRPTGTRDCWCWPASHHSKTLATVPTISRGSFSIRQQVSAEGVVLMKMLKYLRSDERQEFAAPISTDALLGTWTNTNETTRGIAKAMLARKDGQIALRIVATGSPGQNDWG